MGSYFNFKNVGNSQLIDARTPATFPLSRQPSIYSLTFDELQNSLGGGLSKDFGSMNMDEFLKSIWTAETNQAVTNPVCEGDGAVPGANLQRLESLTLPRTLSQKTVDEIWRSLIKEDIGCAKDASATDGSSMPPRQQQSLKEMTLEEFLVRAGAVRDEAEQIVESNNNGLFNEMSRLDDNSNKDFMLGFQQPNQNNGFTLMQQLQTSNIATSNPPASVAMNASEIRSSLLQSQQQLPLQQRQPLFSKPVSVGYAPPPAPLGNGGQLSAPGANKNLISPAAMGVVVPGNAGVNVAIESLGNQISPDGIVRSNGHSPDPYTFSRGRKPSSAVEKVVERRQRRMIKNRESAARSRARKQAYTLELEAEVAKLKELNDELERKQEEILEMQKNQKMETMSRPSGGKRQCLRRTLTGPW